MTHHLRRHRLSLALASSFVLLGVTIGALRLQPLLTYGDETGLTGVLAGGLGVCLLFFGRTSTRIAGWIVAIWGAVYLGAFVFVLSASLKTLLVGCGWTVWGASLVRREPGARSYGWIAMGLLQGGFTPIGVLLCALQAGFILRLREAAAAKRAGAEARPRRTVAA